MEVTICMGFLMALIVFIEIRSYLERKDLLNRIMTKNYSEYSTQELMKQEAKKKTPEYHDEGIPL